MPKISGNYNPDLFKVQKHTILCCPKLGKLLSDLPKFGKNEYNFVDFDKNPET